MAGKASTSKPAARPHPSPAPRPTVQKEPMGQPMVQSPLVQSLVQPNVRTTMGARILGNALVGNPVPGLRSILPKNSMVWSDLSTAAFRSHSTMANGPSA